MSTNFWVGLLVLAVLVVGIYLLVQNYYEPDNSMVATNTPPGNTTTPPSQQPGAPKVSTDASAAVSNSTAVVNGKVTPNGTQTTYWYEYGKTTSLGTRTSAQTIGSGYIALPVPAYITGLTANTTYYFRLSAQNRFSTVNGDTRTFTTNEDQPPQGNSPTTRTNAATAIARTTANLNGRVTPNSAETSVWFEFGETTDLGNATAQQSAGNGTSASDVSVSLSGLKPLTKYYFRLNAQNQFGTVNGSILNFTTQGPPAPSRPSVETQSGTSIGSSTATLNGRVNPSGAETTYWFEYSNDSLLSIILGNTTHTEITGSGTATVTVSATVTGLSADTNYHFRLVGQNSQGTTRGDIETFRTKQ